MAEWTEAFSDIRERLGRIEGKLDSLGTRMDRHEDDDAARFQSVNQGLTALNGVVATVRLEVAQSKGGRSSLAWAGATVISLLAVAASWFHKS